MRKILVFSTLIFFSTLSVSMAEDLTSEKKSDITQLLETTGALDMGKQMSSAVIQQMTQILKSTRPDIPDKMYDILEEEVNLIIEEQMSAEGGLVELTIIIYHRYYSHEDIKGLLSFYRTELGKKLIKTQTQVVQESIQAGQMWGQTLGPIIQERLEARFKNEGIDLSI
jgi:hypothetical protein